MLENIFSTPIEYLRVKDNIFISEVNTLYEECEKNDLFKNNWMPGNDTTPTTYKSHNNILINNAYLTKFIERKSEGYLDNVGADFSSVRIDCSWFNKQNKFQAVGLHNHRHPSLAQAVSGVFYVKTNNDPDQGKIVFKSHNPFDCEFPSNLEDPKYSSEVSYLAIQNGMIFFPSTIQHKVTPNNTDFERVVLSFNIEIVK